MLLSRYDPATGPTAQSVVFDLLEAINHTGLLKAAERRKAERLIRTSGLAHDPERMEMAIKLLGL